MKKVITKPDGSTEVIEGTAEEIAEYERKVRGEIRETPAPKQGPGLLTDELERLLGDKDFLEKMRESRKPQWPLATGYRPSHSDTCQIAIARRGAWLCVIPPRCDCGAEPALLDTYGITWFPITRRYRYSTDSGITWGDCGEFTFGSVQSPPC